MSYKSMQRNLGSYALAAVKFDPRARPDEREARIWVNAICEVANKIATDDPRYLRMSFDEQLEYLEARVKDLAEAHPIPGGDQNEWHRRLARLKTHGLSVQHAEVARLRDEGYDAVEIAHKMGLEVRQIETLLQDL